MSNHCHSRARNHNSVASISSAIILNGTTSTKIANANSERMYFYVTNNSSVNGVWIKLQAASGDNDKKGIYLAPAPAVGQCSFWEMPVDNIYTGEISAIAVADSPDVYVTEY